MVPIRDKWMPLMHACARNDIEMVKRLLSHGADVNVASQSAPGEPYDYNSAVLESIKDAEILQILLNHGADVNLTDALGNTPLLTLVKPQEDPYSDRDDYDTEDPDLLNCVRMLLERGLDIMHKDNDGKTAFDYIEEGSEMEALLLEYRDRKSVLM